MSLDWYREQYGPTVLGRCPRDTQSGCELQSSTVQAFFAAAAQRRHVAARDAPCPREWRSAVEEWLKDIPYGPKDENSAQSTLP